MDKQKGLSKSFYTWGTAILGLAFLAAGIFMFWQGWHTRSEVQASLVAEGLEVSDPQMLLEYENARAPEGVEVPTVLIDTAMEAHYQAEVIRTHTLGITGGKTYSELDREDPARATYITSLTLQTSLHLAHVSLEISRLILGIGVAFAGFGAYTLAIGLPLVRRAVL
jgi:hypothetical protein